LKKNEACTSLLTFLMLLASHDFYAENNYVILHACTYKALCAMLTTLKGAKRVA
jgi:hypothetical protein